MATTCNKDEQKQNAKNKAESWIKRRELGRPLKTLSDHMKLYFNWIYGK
jgi:hypothetical protein